LVPGRSFIRTKKRDFFAPGADLFFGATGVRTGFVGKVVGSIPPKKQKQKK
jgi:hypothetical protein